ncbi:MAG: cellulase family glycosylhydrolase [Chloroflexota bacterium]
MFRRGRRLLNSHRVRLALHIVVIAGLLGMLVLSHFAEGFFMRGVAERGDLEPIAHTPENPMAVNTFFDLEADPDVVERSMDMIADAGFGYIRQSFGWFDIEPQEKGVFENNDGESSWEKFDHIVELAEERDIQIIARLEKPPRWARFGQPNLEQFPDGPPDRISDWIDYVRAVATRYEGRIHHYQIWNEPNLTGEWGGEPIDPRGYVDLLQVAYETIDGIDPDAVVLLAGLAPTEQTGPENLSDLLFLEQVYEYGGAEYFDVATAMVYGYGFSPYDRRVSFERNNFSRVIQTREIMVEYGDEHKPVWAMEYGWVSLPDDWTGEPSPWGEPVSAEKQAEFLVEGYIRAQNEWPWMGVMAVWAFRFPQPDDDPDQARNPTRGFALVNYDFTPRPAYDALRTAADDIQRLGVGVYDVTGEMREAIDEARPIRLAMRGQRVDVTVEGNDGGAVEIGLDGLSRRSFDLEPGETQNVTLARDLPDGEHDIEIAVLADPGGEPSEVTQFTISRSPIHGWIYPWINGVLVIALILTVGSFIWSLIPWRRSRLRGWASPAGKESAQSGSSTT